MSEKHENIEDFVRKVVDQSEAQIPFNESHWQQMESMLDAELPVVSNPGTGYYYFSNVVSLLVGAVFVWLWFTGTGNSEFQTIANQDSEINETLKQTSVPENSSREIKSTSEINPETQAATSVDSESAEVEQDSQSVSKSLKSSASGLASASTIDLSSDLEGTREVENSIKSRDVPSVPTQTSETTVTDKRATSLSNAETEAVPSDRASDQTKIVQPSVFEEAEASQALSSAKEEVVLIDREEEVSDERFDALSGIGIDLHGSVPLLPSEIAKVEVFEPDGGSSLHNESPIINGSSRGPFSRFSIGISLAPDLSSNEIFRYNRLGRDLGIVIDYWITPRLSVSVGAFNTSKRYLVGGAEYNPPAGFWGNITNGELPAKIDAKCQVLDIPVNLKYQLISRPNFNVAASAGVSSYIMLKEDYRYELDNGWQSEWGTRNENQHFFGVGNLQVHFERRFGKHFAFEVAPFFKVPLTSFGHGNIRFHSMGSFFTLRKYFLSR